MAISTTTATWIYVTTAVIAAASGTYAAVDSHQQGKANAKFNEDVAEANAKAAANEARATEEQAAEQARRQQLEKRRALSSMRAQYGASGAALDSGSPLAQLAVSAGDMSLAASDTLAAGHAKASSLDFQSQLYKSSAQQAAMSSPSTGSLIGNLTGTWAGAAAKAAGAAIKYNEYKASKGEK